MKQSRLSQAIHEILIAEWDPIGVGSSPRAQDEYDSYISGIERLLAGGADCARLAQHLQWIEQSRMGLRASPDRNERVAERLFAVSRERMEIE